MSRMKHRTILAVALCAVSVFTTPAMANKPDTRNRAEIPAEFRWDFTAI